MDNRVKEFLEGRDTLKLGPKILELSISSICDNSCLGCWCHSPLIKRKPIKEKFLSLEKIKEIITELKELGLEEVQVSGAGEPLLHPNFWEILDFLKKKGLKTHLVTNFISIKEEELKKFFEDRTDSITISLWSSTPESYEVLHPNRTGEDFIEISRKVRLLIEERENKNLNYPKVKIYHVLNHLNADEIEEMLEHALKVGADMIEFKSIDTIPGKTDFLSYTQEDIEKIKEEMKNLKKRIDFPYSKDYNPYEIPNLKIFSDYKIRRELIDYGKYLETSFLPENFTVIFGKFDKNNPEAKQLSIKCPFGKINHRSILKEDENAFYFFYFREHCKGCKKEKECFEGNEIKEIKLPFLSLMAGGRLEREIENFSKYGSYGNEIVDKIPCYAGWLYSRIETDGSVIPCCKGHNFPVGNIFEKSFIEIWNGEKQRKFRNIGREKKKDNPIFQLIGCRKNCDNIGMNISFHGEVLKFQSD